jgi:hypothetical protein
MPTLVALQAHEKLNSSLTTPLAEAEIRVLVLIYTTNILSGLSTKKLDHFMIKIMFHYSKMVYLS